MTSLRTMEFELPLIATFLLIMLCYFYFSKKRIILIENRTYEVMLITSLVCSIIDTVIHFICSIYTFEQVQTKFYVLLEILNKFVSTGLVLVFSMLCLYTILISKKKIREKPKNIIKIFAGLNILFFILTWFCNIELVNVGLGTNATGSLMSLAFGAVAFFLVLTLFFTIFNFKKDDRYHAIFMILGILVILYVCAVLFKAFIIYDIAMAFFCYIMYFTIENPDVKMIETVREARDQAERANRAKSDFLSSMSHEIRTPLNAIVGLSEDMQARGNCPDDMKDDLTDVVAASRTLLEIVGNIMDISKIESEKMEITNIPYKFKEEISSLARVVGSRIGDKPIEYKINIAEDIPYELIGDKGHIKEVINNLLSNSIKYTEKGFIELNARCINKGDKCLLIISVKDTGRGIKASDISKLFNKFERLDVEKNSTTEGTGLGLAITKKLVELMNGKINVESRYGVGSIFMVQIPQKISKMTKPLLEDELLNTVELDLKKKDLNYSDKRLLIVDDNPLNIKVAKRNILPLGFMSIDEVSNGQECLDKINQGYKYDLILMDIMMPVMSGETALAKLKEIPGFNTPVIALTADAIAGAEEKYRSQGFTDYVSKPFSKDIIKLKIDSIFVNQIKEEKKELDNRWNDAPAAVFGIDSIDDLYKM